MLFYLFIGISGSGKTTQAKEIVRYEPDTKRINKDDLRRMFDDSIFSKENEIFINAARDLLITEALKKGFNVVSDDTNLSEPQRNKLIELAESFGAEVITKDLRGVLLLTCLSRNRTRPENERLTEKSIGDMYNKFVKLKIK